MRFARNWVLAVFSEFFPSVEGEGSKPPFNNREHNSESASTIDRVITPLMSSSNIFSAAYKSSAQSAPHFYASHAVRPSSC